MAPHTLQTPIPKRLRHQVRAITLIEILVTISIIAGLVALMIPSLGRVKEQLNITRCASNLRQISIYSASWSSDNDGWLPPALWYQTNNYKANLRTMGMPDSVLVCRAAKTTNSYGINIRLVSGSSPQWGPNDVWFYTHARYKLSSLNPTTTLFVTETIYGAGTAGYYLSHPSYMNYPHRNSANVLFVDGHVEFQPTSFFTNITTFTRGISDQETSN